MMASPGGSCGVGLSSEQPMGREKEGGQLRHSKGVVGGCWARILSFLFYLLGPKYRHSPKEFVFWVEAD